MFINRPFLSSRWPASTWTFLVYYCFYIFTNYYDFYVMLSDFNCCSVVHTALTIVPRWRNLLHMQFSKRSTLHWEISFWLKHVVAKTRSKQNVFVKSSLACGRKRRPENIISVATKTSKKFSGWFRADKNQRSPHFRSIVSGVNRVCSKQLNRKMSSSSSSNKYRLSCFIGRYIS